MPFIVGRVASTARRPRVGRMLSIWRVIAAITPMRWPRVGRNSAELTFRWLTDCLFLVVTMLHHTNLKRELRTIVTFSISALWHFCAVAFCTVAFCTVAFLHSVHTPIILVRNVRVCAYTTFDFTVVERAFIKL